MQFSRNVDPDLKPPELQSLIENFCLGTRRLHLYGSKNALRRGWLTVSGEGKEFGEESNVQQVENEESQWEAKEWDRDSWEARWRKTGEQGDEEPGDGAGGSEKVATLLPYIEGTLSSKLDRPYRFADLARRIPYRTRRFTAEIASAKKRLTFIRWIGSR